jgi:hypothetical protein
VDRKTVLTDFFYLGYPLFILGIVFRLPLIGQSPPNSSKIVLWFAWMWRENKKREIGEREYEKRKICKKLSRFDSLFV